jgi:glycosyltransferase 2 family protein
LTVSKLLLIAKMLASIGLVWWLLRSSGVHAVIERLRDIRITDVILALGLINAQVVLLGIRWWLIGKACATALSLDLAMRFTFIGMFFNQMLPTTVGGDVVRVYYAVREGVPMGRAVVVGLIDRMVGVIVLICLVAAITPAFYAVVPDPRLGRSLAVIVFMGLSGVSALLILGANVVTNWIRWRLVRRLGRVATELWSVLSRRESIPVIALSVGSHLAPIGVIILLAEGVGVWLDPWDALVLVTPVILIMLMPVSFGGWGVRESALVVALAQVGVAASDALALSIAFGLAYVGACIPGGVLWLFGGKAGPPEDVMTEQARDPSA